jgi:hypothetical protein
MNPELEALFSVLNRSDAQQGLIRLYGDSQKECTRNGACGMEIGMSREKDLCAILKLFLGDRINLEVNNDLPEDFLIDGKKVSIKHSQSKIGSAVKAKWTSADKAAQDAVTAMIEAEDSYYPHLLLVYLDPKTKKICMICISSEQNQRIIKAMGITAFKLPKGNSRGIEYSMPAMKELMKSLQFRVDIDQADLMSGLDPIQRRMNTLREMGLNQ